MRTVGPACVGRPEEDWPRRSGLGLDASVQDWRSCALCHVALASH